MKLLFLQLASPTFEPEDHRSNVPLAAGNLAASAGRGHQSEVLDRDLLDRAGDAALARILAERDDDLVAATLYCWNSHRTLDVLARARSLRPGLRVVVGGPEVDRGNEFLTRAAGVSFDAAASGEGEELLAELLAGGDPSAIAGLGRAVGTGAMEWTAPRPPVADLATLPSPYLSETVRLRSGGIAHLETARGCVFECDFCFYHADFRKVRTFPRARVAEEIEKALGDGARDLYLMDPTFNGHSGYRETLRALRGKLLDRGATVHTELRAEPIDAKGARELAEAGITSVEVGLQTVTPAALAAVGRTFDRERFARGCRALGDAGIRVEIGTIVGLPHDTPAGLEETFRFAREECGARAETVPFVLSLLPATVLRERAADFGLEASPFPPYQIRRSRTFDGDAIRATLERYEEIFEEDLDPIGTVRLVERGEGAESQDLAPSDLVRRAFVDLERATPEELTAAGRRLAERVESTFCAVLRGGGDRLVEKAIALLGPIKRANAHGLLEIVLECDRPADLVLAARRLRDALPPIEGHYLNEHLRYSAPAGADLSMRIVASLPVESDASWGREIAAALPVVWRADVSSEKELEALLDGPFERGALLLRTKVPIAALLERAGDESADLRFSDSADQREADVAEFPPETVIELGRGARVVAVRRGL